MKTARPIETGDNSLTPSRPALSQSDRLIVAHLLIAAIMGATVSLQLPQAAPPAPAKTPPAATRQVDFAKDVEPIFSSHCYDCHGPKKQEASLRLDQKAADRKSVV